MPGDTPIATVITKRFTIDDPYDHTQGPNRSRGSDVKKGPALEDKELTWLEYQHPEYRRSWFKWYEAQAHYTGELLEEHQIEHFLIRKSSAESWEAYRERKNLADYTPHFSTAVDSLAGMLFQVENNAKRFTGSPAVPGLGDSKNLDEPFHRLWHNIDGFGTNWITFFKQVAIELIHSHTAWIAIDTIQGDNGVARLWPAMSVTNWRWEDGRLVEVVVEEVQDVRASIKDEPQFEERWVVYKLTGWERWRKDEKSGDPVLVDEGGYTFEDEMEQPILPIFPISLPMSRHVGWMMARKANVIFNKESERDHLLRAANFPFLLLVMADKQFRTALNKIRQGVRALQVDPSHGGNHSFIAPGSESATVATSVLERKVDEFYVTFFQSYGDSARERTATEARQDVSAGVGAFLQLLKVAVDEAENNVMKLLAQIEFPADERRWFVNTVQRSEDFLPMNVAAEIEKIKERYFGADKIVPIGKTGRAGAAKRIAEWDGLEIDENELNASLILDAASRALDLLREVSMPPQAKAELTITTLIALNILDPELMVEMEDGEDRKLVDVIKEKAEALAEAEQKRISQLGEMGMIPPGQPGGPPPGSDEDEDEDEEEDED